MSREKTAERVDRDHRVATFRSLLAAELGGPLRRLLRSAMPEGDPDPERLLDRLTDHYRLLCHWNRKVRLVGSLEPDVVVQRHVVESLRLLPYLHEPRGGLLDIGSGNGFPAIPIRCARSALRLVMMEPTLRKSLFLETVAARLAIDDCSVIRARVDRASDLEQEAVRSGPWDVITMRAVAAIPAVLQAAPRALRAGGRVLLLVGDKGLEEVRSAMAPPLELIAHDLIPGRKASYIVAIRLSHETIH